MKKKIKGNGFSQIPLFFIMQNTDNSQDLHNNNDYEDPDNIFHLHNHDHNS